MRLKPGADRAPCLRVQQAYCPAPAPRPASKLHRTFSAYQRRQSPAPAIRALETEEVKPGTDTIPLKGGAPRWLPQRLRGMKILGLEPSPELVAISMVYFVQGILGLSRLAVAFYLKDSLHIDPAELAVMQSIAAFPWMVKPLYGFISDSIPLFGYHRRSYLILAGLTGFCGWAGFCFIVDDKPTALAAMLMASLSNAASDVLVDSLVVERARDAPQHVGGSLQSLCWGSSAVGGILSAYWSGYLVEAIGSKGVFGITASFPLVVSCAALLIDEQRLGSKVSDSGSPPAVMPTSTGKSSDLAYKAQAGMNGSVHHRGQNGSSQRVYDASWDPERAPLLNSHVEDPMAGSVLNGDPLGPAPVLVSHSRSNSSHIWNTIKTRCIILWGAVTRKEVLLPAMFVFAWQATPSADSAMFFFQTNELGFQPEFMGRVRLVSNLAHLAGVVLYNTKFKKLPLRTFLWWTMVIGVMLGSTQLVLVSRLNVTLGLSDQLFVLGDTALLTALGQCSFMPLLVLAARICPQGVEATMFATLMSILNAGSFVGGGLGAGLTKALGVTSSDFTNLFTLVLICNLGQLLPAPLLKLLPDTVDTPGEDEDESETDKSAEYDPEQGGRVSPVLPSKAIIDVDAEMVGAGPQGIKAGHKGTPLDLGIGDAMHASDTQHNKVL